MHMCTHFSVIVSSAEIGVRLMAVGVHPYNRLTSGEDGNMVILMFVAEGDITSSIVERETSWLLLILVLLLR